MIHGVSWCMRTGRTVQYNALPQPRGACSGMRVRTVDTEACCVLFMQAAPSAAAAATHLVAQVCHAAAAGATARPKVHGGDLLRA